MRVVALASRTTSPAKMRPQRTMKGPAISITRIASRRIAERSVPKSGKRRAMSCCMRSARLDIGSTAAPSPIAWRMRRPPIGACERDDEPDRAAVDERGERQARARDHEEHDVEEASDRREVHVEQVVAAIVVPREEPEREEREDHRELQHRREPH